MKLNLADFVNSKTFNILTGRSEKEPPIALPKLPPPDHIYETGEYSDRFVLEPGYTEAQMQMFGLEAVRKDRMAR